MADSPQFPHFTIPGGLPKPIYERVKALKREMNAGTRAVVSTAILLLADVWAGAQQEAVKARLQAVREMDG